MTMVVMAPGPNDHGSVTARRGHSSVTARSQLSHGEVTAQSRHLQYDHGSVTARSQLNHGPGHGSVTAGWDHFSHRELTVSSQWAVTVANFFLMGMCHCWSVVMLSVQFLSLGRLAVYHKSFSGTYKCTSHGVHEAKHPKTSSTLVAIHRIARSPGKIILCHIRCSGRLVSKVKIQCCRSGKAAKPLWCQLVNVLVDSLIANHICDTGISEMWCRALLHKIHCQCALSTAKIELALFDWKILWEGPVVLQKWDYCQASNIRCT